MKDNKSMKKKKHHAKEKEKGSRENVEVNPEDFKEMKKRGVLGNLYLKGLGNLGLVENTQLETTFVDSMAQHEEYRRNVGKVLDSAELMLQPNYLITRGGKLNEDKFVKEDGSRPFTHRLSRLAHHIQALAPFMNPMHGKPEFLGPGERHILATLPQKCIKMMEAEKTSRTNTRAHMNRTRLFLTTDLKEFKENRTAVDKNLLVMDDMRNEVKKAKTKAELESAGKGYTAAVYEFNRRADLIDRVLESHAENVFFHQRDLSRMFSHRQSFHNEMAKMLQEWDLEVVAAEKKK